MVFQSSRRNVLLAGSALTAATLFGCSSTGAGPTSKTSALVAPTGTASVAGLTPNPSAADLAGGPTWKPADLSGQTITMWGLNYAPHVERYKLLIEMFKKATNCEVRLQPQSFDDLSTVLVKSAGKPPDVLCFMGKAIGTMVRQKALVNLTSMYTDLGVDMTKWWYDEALSAYNYNNGEIYGVPLESSAMNTAVVRADLMDKNESKLAGLIPKGNYFESYDDLFQAAQILQVKKGDTVKIWGVNQQNWESTNIPSIMWQQGALWWDEQAGTFNFDTDAGVKAFELVVSKPYAMGIESTLAADSSSNFISGQVAIAVTGAGAAGGALQNGIEATNYVRPSAVAGQAPKFIGEGGWGFEVLTRAKNPEAAMEWAKFVTTYEAQFSFTQIYNRTNLAACRPLAKSAIYQGDGLVPTGMRRALTAVENTRFMGHGYDPTVESLISKQAGALREGKTTAKEAAAALQKAATAQQKRYASQG